MPELDPSVIDRVHAEYPEATWPEIEVALATYGVESHERDVLPVQLAILKLARGRVDQVHYLVERAKRDYRDVLTWATARYKWGPGKG